MVTSYQQMRRRLRYSTTILPQSSTGNLSPHPSQVKGLRDGDQRGEAPPTVREDQVHDHLRNLNIHKSL